MKLSALATMLMMTLSCAAANTAPAEPWRIAVTSSGGFAGKGAGSFSIDSNGAVAVTTMARQSCTFQATEGERKRFVELLTNAQPETWDASYVPENSCCDRIEYELTVDEAGKTKTVKWIDDPRPMPTDLEALTEAMVGGPESLRVVYGGKCR